ncbi:MAG TPA: acyl-CoA carboxylase subunit epsilon [Streptosporangiaceae bacterium]|nr:acyl-CoA carboxylase subunit epsilon [Streptosporangiaceae bacterium]
MPADSGSGAPPVPVLSVVAGRPTDAELAAVVVVLSARAAQSPVPGPARRPARSLWSSRQRQLRPQLTAGPGAWRASGLPE